MHSSKGSSRALAWVCLLSCLSLSGVSATLHQASYQRPVTDDELTSPITRTIDKQFSRFAEELWRRYLTNTKVSYVENNADCAAKHRAEIESVAKGKIYVGDQEDVSVLSEIVEDAKQFSGYDIIVDDGGHKSSQMLASFKVLWQSLKSGGIYVVEDISENYIEKPFLAKGTFTDFIKNAIDVVQCRMKPNYMGPDSPVRREFMEFCAANPMDIISVECMPEACVLVKGKPRTRGLPAATPVPADKAQIAAQEEVAAVGGAEEAAADLFKPKATAEKAATAKTAVQQKGPPAAEAAAASKEADNADDEDTIVLSPAKKGKPGGKSAEQFLKADDLDDDGDVAALPKPSLSQQSDRPSWKKNFAADDEEEEEEEETFVAPTLVKPKGKPAAAAASTSKAAQSKKPAKASKAGDGGAAAKAAAMRAALPEVEEEAEEDAFEVEEAIGEDLSGEDDQDGLMEPAAEEEAFADAFTEEDEEAMRHRKFL
ncbi:hypothetical protein COCSUDRAFT_64337 [Coccomyxa subellipsoidea C-169]|uniref:S-adenosyl-L-methionine-dependent methyltransferase n=1 Tax=Coccomyxa subellipsoidea (strain C-169) TaxID=574566 RepID=I0ZAM6_COCSC|nr:hypothetical protein COCSUDRAFT_64337 [Coccomyxa subellipsoidea C-169]EIE27695.1 hypothetical protein COCSUDRAFT_64337 [Coccomyxa subellipsoidea C-169]|eukprot:XP_005652239.1 hypothetical protein COCSUDRAFT_64337 [Coccomyxa subellipsoidea C-169]